MGFRINPPQVVGHGPNPPRSPLIQAGTLFSIDVAPQGGMKNSHENPLYKRGKEGETAAVVAPSGGCLNGFQRPERQPPGASRLPWPSHGNVAPQRDMKTPRQANQ